MTVYITGVNAKARAKAIIDAGGGTTDDLDVLDALVALAPADTVYVHTSSGNQMSQSALKGLRNQGLDIRPQEVCSA